MTMLCPLFVADVLEGFEGTLDQVVGRGEIPDLNEALRALRCQVARWRLFTCASRGPSSGRKPARSRPLLGYEARVAPCRAKADAGPLGVPNRTDFLEGRLGTAFRTIRQPEHSRPRKVSTDKHRAGLDNYLDLTALALAGRFGGRFRCACLRATVCVPTSNVASSFFNMCANQ